MLQKVYGKCNEYFHEKNDYGLAGYLTLFFDGIYDHSYEEGELSNQKYRIETVKRTIGTIQDGNVFIPCDLYALIIQLVMTDRQDKSQYEKSKRDAEKNARYARGTL